MSANIVNKGLGLRADFKDPKDDNFRFLLTREEEPVAIKTTRHAYFDHILDQGYTGTCVGHSTKYLLAMGPIIEIDVYEDPSAFALYRAMTLKDPWPENDNGDVMFGTSMNAAGHVLRDMGRIGRWEHSESVDDLIKFIAGRRADGSRTGGPALVGIPWYTGMYETDAEGFLHATGRIDGYHAIALPHYNVERDFFWFPNSWGYSFGPWDAARGRQSGHGRIPGDTMRKFFNEGGEAILTRELRAA